MSGNNNRTKRKRFHKSFSFAGGERKHPWRCLRGVFKLFHLDDIRSEMKQWIHLALINDQSAYEDDASREDLLEFSDQLLRLVEALYILHVNHQQETQSGNEPVLPLSAIESIRSSNQINNLNEEEKTNPVLVVKSFAITFSKRYCTAEMWDLLDAGVTSQPERKISRSNLTLFCQSMLCLCRVNFVFNSSNDSENKPA